MSKTNRTKRVFANALLELSNKKPLPDITILDITNFCDISRTAFYYHFKDKQELIFWIYTDFRNTHIKLSDSSDVIILGCLKYMQKYPVFFKQAFSESGQNCFRDELGNSIYLDFEHVLTNVEMFSVLSAHEREMVARLYAHATVGIIEMLLDAPPSNLERAVGLLTAVLYNGSHALKNMAREI